MTALVAALVAAKIALHLALAERYGYAADELYVLACSDRLDWGYVGAEPLAAWVAFAGRVVFGSSLFGVRLVPALAGALLMVVSALLARRLGGGRYAAALAALATGFAPPLLGASGTLGAAALAPLAWTSLALLVAGAEQRGRGVPVTAFAALTAAAVLVAPGLVVFAALLPLALVLTWSAARRGAWIGAAAAALLLVPALQWQLGRDWPPPALAVPRFAGDVAAQGLALLGEFHVLLAPLLVAGVVGLLVLPRLAAGRGLGAALAATVAVVVEFRLHPALLVPLAPLAFTAGAVVVEAIGGVAGLRWVRAVAVAAVVAAAALLAPLQVPLLPLDAVPRYAAAVAPAVAWPLPPAPQPGLPDRFAAMLGWPELVQAARRGLEALPLAERGQADLWVRTRWQAAAFDRLGERHGMLPPPVCGDGSYADWGAVTGIDATAVVAVGFAAEELQPWFRRVEPLGVAECDLCPPARRRLAVHVASEPRLPAEELWRKAVLGGP